jgi:hypothetical protein
MSAPVSAAAGGWTITTRDPALILALMARWGGRDGIAYDQRIARAALETARERLATVWRNGDDTGWRRVAVASVRRCRAACRKVDAEMEQHTRER